MGKEGEKEGKQGRRWTANVKCERYSDFEEDRWAAGVHSFVLTSTAAGRYWTLFDVPRRLAANAVSTELPRTKWSLLSNCFA